MTPQLGRRLHIAGMAFWGVQMVGVIPIIGMNWKLYLLEISLAANFISHWAGLSAERPSEIV